METFVVFENSYIYMRNKFSHKFIKGGTKIMHNKKYLISVAMPGGGEGVGAQYSHNSNRHSNTDLNQISLTSFSISTLVSSVTLCSARTSFACKLSAFSFNKRLLSFVSLKIKKLLLLQKLFLLHCKIDAQLTGNALSLRTGSCSKTIMQDFYNR